MVGHIEAGMRSFDKRILEEINRAVCVVVIFILYITMNINVFGK